MKKIIFCLLVIFIQSINLFSQGWVQQASGTSVNLHSINSHHGNEDNAWTCGDNGVILHTSNGGTNWVQQVSGTTNDLYCICFMETAGGPVMAVGEGGTILRTTNSGTNWVTISSPTTRILRDISDYNFVSVGDSGTILKSSNSGSSWFQQNSNTAVTLRSVEYSVNNTSRIYICGDNGTIIKSTNEGGNFGFQTTPTTQNLNSIFFYLDDNTGYACGNNGTILKTTNGGGPIITSVQPVNSKIPEKYSLEQNYPNPFNPSTKIKFSIPEEAAGFNAVTINIYDISGRLVKTLLNENLSPGTYEVSWSAENYSSGIYYYQLVSGSFTQTKKLLMIK